VTPLDLVVGIGSILDRLNIEWVLGGSLASSIVGKPRPRCSRGRKAVELVTGEVIWVGSAHDQVLRKLSLFRAGTDTRRSLDGETHNVKHEPELRTPRTNP
jgi:hypothetical protein